MDGACSSISAICSSSRCGQARCRSSACGNASQYVSMSASRLNVIRLTSGGEAPAGCGGTSPLASGDGVNRSRKRPSAERETRGDSPGRGSSATTCCGDKLASGSWRAAATASWRAIPASGCSCGIAHSSSTRILAPHPPPSSAPGADAARTRRRTSASRVRLASPSSFVTAATTAARAAAATAGGSARAGERAGCREARTLDLSSDTCSRGECDSTCATAASCGWHSLRIRGKAQSVEMGTQPSGSVSCSIRKPSPATSRRVRYHSTCVQIFSSSVMRRSCPPIGALPPPSCLPPSSSPCSTSSADDETASRTSAARRAAGPRAASTSCESCAYERTTWSRGAYPSSSCSSCRCRSRW
mmetsp:Transcript_16868/g.55230  ORF Transcript_16868/g.55230 Transcript_16868/m.55230 type:complete len:359 (-) Transcript_16868:533-1609(-)